MIELSFFNAPFSFPNNLCYHLNLNMFSEFSCLCRCKGTNFLANHNGKTFVLENILVVYAGAKVLIF